MNPTWNYYQTSNQRNGYFEVLPFDFPSAEFEADALGLNDFKGPEIASQLAIFLSNKPGEILTDLAPGERASNFWNVNVDDLSILGINDRTKIERKRILIVVDGRSVIHQRLLKSNYVSPKLAQRWLGRRTIARRIQSSKDRNKLYSYP